MVWDYAWFACVSNEADGFFLLLFLIHPSWFYELEQVRPHQVICFWLVIGGSLFKSYNYCLCFTVVRIYYYTFRKLLFILEIYFVLAAVIISE